MAGELDCAESKESSNEVTAATPPMAPDAKPGAL